MSPTDAPTPPTDLDTLRQALRQVMDPEVGMNIVDLGLIYQLELADAGRTAVVEMTMTSPACPMGEMIIDDVEAALRPHLPDGARVDIRLVWTPAWTPERMSPEARAHFGW